MTKIEDLASVLLDNQEKQLAQHLTLLLEDVSYDVQSLIEKIIPKYWEHAGDIDVTLHPDNIYRPLYYIHIWSSNRNFKSITRPYMAIISSHLEGCLWNLSAIPRTSRGPSKPFGRLIGPLKASGVLPSNLADSLWNFNDAVNIPSKHFGAYMPTRNLNERTFSVLETALALVMMRKLSIQLFSIMKAKGVILPQEWPVFASEWLSWSKKV